MRRIARELNARGIPGKRGARWTQSTVRRIVHNPVYVGDMLYQKTFMDENYCQKNNKGELDQYYESDHHPPIVSREAFEQVALLVQQRRKLCGTFTEEEDAELAARRQKRYAFTGRLFCAECGGHLHRMSMKGRVIYQCQNKYTGVDSCPQPSVLEASIKNAFITCLNKLAFSQGLSAKDRIIDNYIGGIRNVEERKHAERIAEIDGALERNRMDMNVLTATALVDHFGAEQREKKAAPLREAEALLDNRFLRIIKGVTVNMDYVLQMNDTSCTMCTGMVLPMRSRNGKEIRQQWLNYKFVKIRQKQGTDLRL
jgi:hypothetical protein